MRLTSHMIQKVCGDNFGDSSKLLWTVAISLKWGHPQPPPLTPTHTILQNNTHWRIKIWHVYFKNWFCYFSNSLNYLFCSQWNTPWLKIGLCREELAFKDNRKEKKTEIRVQGNFSFLATNIATNLLPIPAICKMGSVNVFFIISIRIAHVSAD